MAATGAMPPSDPPTRLAFDDVVIDFAGRRVWRGGVGQSLEPKVFGVLTLLASAPGRVFTREEVLDAVWGHRHITPGVLNRAVTLLRHALGEDAQVARYLVTVHGVGYRFDLPPDLERTSAASASGDPASTAQGTVAETTAAPVLGPAPRAKQNATFWLAASLCLLALCGWWWRSNVDSGSSASPATSSPAVIAAATSPTLVVLPLRALGEGEDALAAGLSEELTTRLSRIEGLGVICATSAAIAQSRQFDPAQLADRLKTTHALEGSLREVGERLRVNLRLSELPGGRVIWTEIYDLPTEEFPTLQNEIAADLARTLSLRDVEDAAQPRDVHPKALQRFLDVRRRISNGSAVDWETPLQSLVADYPDYAQPHGLLASLLASNAPARREEAEREASRAMQLDPDEAHAYVALAWIATRDGDWERAEQMYGEILRLAPSDPYYRAAYGLHLGGLGYLDEGLREARIAIKYGPLGGMHVIGIHAHLLDALGRHDEAERTIESALTGPPLPIDAHALQRARWYNTFWRRDAAGARAAAADLPEDVWKASYVAVSKALEDPRQWPQARAAMDESEQISRQQGNKNVANYLRLLDPQAEPSQVLSMTRRLQREVNAFSKLIMWMPERHSLRQTPEFQAFLRDSGLLAHWHRHGFPSQCRPAGEGAHCD